MSHRDSLGSGEVKLPRLPVYKTLRPTAKGLMRRIWDIRFHGEENVPRKGPVILAPNHTGFIDGPLVGIASTRRVYALTKREAFAGGFGVLLRLSGQISIERFDVDPGALRRAAARLQRGDAVAVFPEGTRGPGELQHLKAGAAYLALVTGAPVVPLAFFGTRLPGGANHSVPPRGSRFDVVYGAPVYLGQHTWPRRRTAVAEAHDILSTELRRHLREAQELTGGVFPGPLPDPEDD